MVFSLVVFSLGFILLGSDKNVDFYLTQKMKMLWHRYICENNLHDYYARYLSHKYVKDRTVQEELYLQFITSHKLEVDSNFIYQYKLLERSSDIHIDSEVLDKIGIRKEEIRVNASKAKLEDLIESNQIIKDMLEKKEILSIKLNKRNSYTYFIDKNNTSQRLQDFIKQIYNMEKQIGSQSFNIPAYQTSRNTADDYKIKKDYFQKSLSMDNEEDKGENELKHYHHSNINEGGISGKKKTETERRLVGEMEEPVPFKKISESPKKESDLNKQASDIPENKASENLMQIEIKMKETSLNGKERIPSKVKIQTLDAFSIDYKNLQIDASIYTYYSALFDLIKPSVEQDLIIEFEKEKEKVFLDLFGKETQDVPLFPIVKGIAVTSKENKFFEEEFEKLTSIVKQSKSKS